MTLKIELLSMDGSYLVLLILPYTILLGWVFNQKVKYWQALVNWRHETFICYCWNEIIAFTMENQMEGVQNLKITLLYDPIISLLSIYLKEMESTSQRVV